MSRPFSRDRARGDGRGAWAGTIACLYERGDRTAYETITLARFPLDWLTEGR